MNAVLVFRHIRAALLGMLLMVGLGAGAVRFADIQHRQAEAEQRVAQAARSDALAKLSRAREEEIELRANAARFDQLARLGIVGGERRLDWVERLRAIRDAHMLYDLQYEIAPQQALFAVPGGRFEVMASPMRLSLMLLHEGDLFDLLGDLTGSVPALVRTRRCAVDRIPVPAQPPAGAAPQLRAECEIDWITVRRTVPSGAKS